MIRHHLRRFLKMDTKLLRYLYLPTNATTAHSQSFYSLQAIYRGWEYSLPQNITICELQILSSVHNGTPHFVFTCSHKIRSRVSHFSSVRFTARDPSLDTIVALLKLKLLDLAFDFRPLPTIITPRLRVHKRASLQTSSDRSYRFDMRILAICMDTRTANQYPSIAIRQYVE